jgi:HD-GYP domain-containing protein (c-di-GMP phosphodiesterase class II)
MTQVDTATAQSSIKLDPGTQVIAGVHVTDTPLISAVIEYARGLSEPYLFNHAMRSWLFAEAIGRIKGMEYDREVVAIGTILHDIGLTASVS